MKESKKFGKAPFNVQYQLNLFFKMARVSPHKMPKIQIDEMSKSFYAGFGQCLLLMKNEIPKLKEEKAILEMQKMVAQCEDFWQKKVDETFDKFEEV